MAIRKLLGPDRTPASAAEDLNEPASGLKFEAAVGEDGSVVIPESVRSLMELNSGDRVQLELTFAGLTLRPAQDGRDPDQWWFWTEACQRGLATAEEDVLAGRVTRQLSDEQFEAELDRHA